MKGGEGWACRVQRANMGQNCSLSAVQRKSACVEQSWWAEFDMFGSLPWCSLADAKELLKSTVYNLYSKGMVLFVSRLANPFPLNQPGLRDHKSTQVRDRDLRTSNWWKIMSNDGDSIQPLRIGNWKIMKNGVGETCSRAADGEVTNPLLIPPPEIWHRLETPNHHSLKPEMPENKASFWASIQWHKACTRDVSLRVC